MTQRRTSALVAACTIALACSNSLIANADSNNNGVYHITVTNLQDSTTRDSPVPAENLGAIPAKTSARSYHRARKSSSRSRATTARRLTSRSFSATAEPNIVGRLAMVNQDNVAIYAGRDRNNRVLSAVKRGQYLDICGENNGQYAVLMIDRTIGYVSKDSVQMMEYQVVQGQSTNQNSAAGGDAQSTPAAGSIGQRLVQEAYGYMGVRYVWGGDTRGGIDCSGFVKAVYAASGINLPRVSFDQAAVGYDVPLNDMSKWIPGDRLYFACHHPRIDHTGMYVGNGLFIHAHGSGGHEVGVTAVDEPFYRNHLVAVRRSAELLSEGGAGSSGRMASAQAIAPSTEPPAPGLRPVPSGPDPESNQQ